MKPRISEVRQIVELLDAEHDNVDDLAREVLLKAWQLAGERESWCLVADHPGAGMFVHGPLGSKSEVERAVKRGDIVSAGTGPASGKIVRMVHV
jgi:hypothetical protein